MPEWVKRIRCQIACELARLIARRRSDNVPALIFPARATEIKINKEQLKRYLTSSCGCSIDQSVKQSYHKTDTNNLLFT